MTVYLPNIDDTAHAIGADKKPAAALDDWFGEVKSTSPFRVAPLGSTVGLECTPIGSADVGDVVYVTTRKNGHFVAHCGVSGGGGSGHGLPAGGNTDDILMKRSVSSYDVEWTAPLDNQDIGDIIRLNDSV